MPAYAKIAKLHHTYMYEIKHKGDDNRPDGLVIMGGSARQDMLNHKQQVSLEEIQV